MYKIIGSDNSEYGPVSGEKIREWLKEGRVDSQTKVRAEGSTDWKPLSEFAEFAEPRAVGGGAPPPLPFKPMVSTKTSGMAITSLVLGILGWFTLGVTALIGLVLGIIAMIRINRSQGALRGSGLALAGTIVSAVVLVILPIMAAMLLPALAGAKTRAQSIVCMNNLKQLGLGELMYASDNKDRLPSADKWSDAIGKYIAGPRTFQCPSGNRAQPCHYAFNARLSEVELKNITNPSQTVLLFEADGGWNASGGSELMLSHPRHQNMVGIVFADGHCEMAKESKARRVRWDP